jgi:hypothetical protein
MPKLQMGHLVSEYVVDLATRHALEEEIRKGDGVAGAGEGIGHLTFAGGNNVELLEFDA